MPRPLHEPDIRNPTKIQNAFATPVGADRCVGPLRTCRFRARAHTQVRPYKATRRVQCRCRGGAYPPCAHPRPYSLSTNQRIRCTEASREALCRPAVCPCSPALARTRPRSGPGCRGTAPARCTEASREALCRPAVCPCSPKLARTRPRSGNGSRACGPCLRNVHQKALSMGGRCDIMMQSCAMLCLAYLKCTA